jgi:excisionase family DNA binding protein
MTQRTPKPIPFERRPAPTADEGALLTVNEAAALLGCKARKVQYLAASGALPAVRYMRGLRFRRSAILAFIAQHET